MSTADEKESLRRLVQHVSRAFYEPRYTIVLDQLSRHVVIKDDDLAGRIGLQNKELNKLMAVLANDRLVSVFRQNELKEGAQRSVPKQYYYIDYQLLCNVVKWRIAEMRRIIDKTLRNELDTKGYICPQCTKSFSPLEVDKLVDFATGAFNCDVCGAELVDNEDADAARGAQDRMQRFNAQLRHVRDGLRASEDMVMPALDVAAYVRTHLVGPDATAGGAADDTGPGAGARGAREGGELRIAGSGVKTEEAGLGVVLSMGEDVEAARAERAKAAEAKKAQNALPSWHLKSTISGDLTALGVAESARAAAAAAASAPAPPSSNDEILRGLGKVRPAQQQAEVSLAVVEETKPIVDGTGDYYDQYYASLAASAASQSTPGSAPAEEFEEEEDIKPNVEYLNSLNDYRKRVRSEEEEASERARKLVKTEPEPEPEPFVEDRPINSDGGEDDPVVYVNGEPMAFSAVTEEHQELMTPEEYEAYFAVLSSRS